MNIFADRQTSKKFTNALIGLSPEQKKEMFNMARELFDRKSVSEEDEFEKFKINEKDIKLFAKKIAR